MVGLAADTSDDRRWWKASEDETSRLVFGVLEGISDTEASRLDFYREVFELLGSRYVDILPNEYITWDQRIRRRGGGKDNRRAPLMPESFNALRRAVETVSAIVGEAEPRPVYTTEGDADLAKLAKDQSDAIYATLRGGGGYESIRKAFAVFAAETGTGFVEVVESRNDEREEATLSYKCVFPWEVFVDPVDAYYGEPRSLFRVQLWDRDAALSKWARGKNAAKAREAITSAPRARTLIPNQTETGSIEGDERAVDQILVIFAWHRASGPEAKDGVAVVCTKTGELERKPYASERFPIQPCYWRKPRIGFWGEGLVEEGAGVQGQLDETQEKTQDLFGTQSMPVVAVHEQDRDLLGKLSARGVRMLSYKHGPPHRIVDPVVHPQVLQREEQLKQDVFEQVGTNMLSATGRRPEGLSSGQALRDFRNISVEPFKTSAKNLDEAVVALAQATEDAAVRLEDEGYKVVLQLVPGGRLRKGSGSHEWRKIRDRRSDFSLGVEVASSTAKSLSGRNSDLQDLFNSGSISRERFLQNFHAPDLKAYLRRETALADLADKWVGTIREGGTPPQPIELPPEAMLFLAREITLEYARAYAEEEPGSVLSGFATLLARLQRIVDQQTAKLQAQAQAAQLGAAARSPEPGATGPGQILAGAPGGPA